MTRTKTLDARARELLEELAGLAAVSGKRTGIEVAWAQRHAVANAIHRAIQADRRARKAVRRG